MATKKVKLSLKERAKVIEGLTYAISSTEDYLDSLREWRDDGYRDLKLEFGYASYARIKDPKVAKEVLDTVEKHLKSVIRKSKLKLGRLLK